MRNPGTQPKHTNRPMTRRHQMTEAQESKAWRLVAEMLSYQGALHVFSTLEKTIQRLYNNRCISSGLRNQMLQRYTRHAILPRLSLLTMDLPQFYMLPPWPLGRSPHDHEGRMLAALWLAREAHEDRSVL